MNRTIGNLLKALQPKGDVSAWVPLQYTGGELSKHRLYLKKTDLIESLKKLNPDDPAHPFAIHEWDWETTSGYHMRAREVILNDFGGDNIEPRRQGGYGTTF